QIAGVTYHPYCKRQCFASYGLIFSRKKILKKLRRYECFGVKHGLALSKSNAFKTTQKRCCESIYYFIPIDLQRKNNFLMKCYLLEINSALTMFLEINISSSLISLKNFFVQRSMRISVISFP